MAAPTKKDTGPAGEPPLPTETGALLGVAEPKASEAFYAALGMTVDRDFGNRAAASVTAMTLADLQDRTFARATPATVESYPPERRLTAAQLATYLDRRTYAVIGTTRPVGRPHASMSMYVRRGATFWLPTVSGSVRAQNLRDQPWLTLVVAEEEFDHHIVVIVEGPAETLKLDETPGDVRAAVDRDWVGAWIRLRAERLLSYAAAAATA